MNRGAPTCRRPELFQQDLLSLEETSMRLKWEEMLEKNEVPQMPTGQLTIYHPVGA